MKLVTAVKQRCIARCRGNFLRFGLRLGSRIASGIALAPSLTATAAIALTITATSPAHAAPKEIPAVPYYYVLDEPHVLSQQALRTVESLLIEHDRIAGEQIMVAIFQSLDGPNVDHEDAGDFTNRVFDAWRIGKHGKDNGALLALYWNDHQDKIVTGYGLETLTTAKAKSILTDDLEPELKNGNPDRAVVLTTLEILRALGSPLIQNGKAEEILKSGGFDGNLQPSHIFVVHTGGMGTWLFFGIILLFAVLRTLTAAEAHFTRDGWFRPKPWAKLRALLESGRAHGGSPHGGGRSGTVGGATGGW